MDFDMSASASARSRGIISSPAGFTAELEWKFEFKGHTYDEKNDDPCQRWSLGRPAEIG